MNVIKKQEFLKNKFEYLSLVEKGRAFIYPTDTIYGIGCDATNTKAVKHVYSLKRRINKPLSVIAPSKKWILDNCKVGKEEKKWLGKLPGKYTLILKLKNKKAVSRSVHLGDYTIGVRIPKHWFSSIVYKYGKPIVTTSVNISEMAIMTSFKDLNKTIREKVAFVIYEGVKKAHPSIIIDLVKGKVKKR
ncbi:threonylcarbamoyl-AMP synthase [Candidatus Woesearchaeota archaeon CG10_big_fil_rev_8_21_14_0_10_34_8]|nr:MAG: threonylcarbamoyl-AMP synthase [Candidatus Woesearchaeota archaeon CG10_big_fil_rev_8_21_14_0_10_34_8]